MLTKEEVLHVAKLARIAINESEEEKLQEDLSSILDFVEQLKEVNVENIKPLFHSIPLKNIMRRDEVALEKDEAAGFIKEAMPDCEGDHLKIKTVF